MKQFWGPQELGRRGEGAKHSTHPVATFVPGPSGDSRERGVLAGQHTRVPLIAMLGLLVRCHLGANWTRGGKKNKIRTSCYRNHIDLCFLQPTSPESAMPKPHQAAPLTSLAFSERKSASNCFRKGSNRFVQQVLSLCPLFLWEHAHGRLV